MLSTIAKLKNAMELVVDVIGELETTIKVAAGHSPLVVDNGGGSAFVPRFSTSAASANVTATMPANSVTAHSGAIATASSSATPASAAQNELLDYKAIMDAIDKERKTPVPSSE